jgi:DNA replication and repair protein RecF
MLSDAKRERRSVDESISSWNEQLALYGAKVMKQREQFIATFQEYVSATYCNIIAGAEEPTLAYTPQVVFHRDTTEEEIAALIQKEIEKEFHRECNAGTTLVGPHHDEVELRINGFDLRKFASQGQHKTFLIALKIAEFHYLASRCNETPILLLDDMFAELDDTRAAHVLDIVRTFGQTFVTCTNANVFDAVLEYNGKHKKIVVEEGNCSSPFWEPNSITSNISE